MNQQARSELTILLLLRHGETALTPERRFSGVGGADPGLSEVGRSQAARAAGSTLLVAAGVEAVVCSPLRRCRQTAAVVARRLGLEVVVEEGLREADFGDWDGLTSAEVQERFPEDLRAWRASARVAPTGSAESFAEVARRVDAFKDVLLSRYRGQRVLAVTHVGVVKALVQLALRAPAEAVHAMELSPAAFSCVAYAGSTPSLRLYNDTAHLR
ncbi:histidine phosphatase family protein [Streptacidiphilus melanogenes]|uniref:histidine phosphatase family protein n=1 Tax=Streptacidiphilus melanogenes TaxID=411235 RepID=UPI0009FC4A09|nr:histidine phosphatase family protein [Streptacidiphilus melanogenes]